MKKLLILTTLLLMISCGKGVKVKGKFALADKESIYLELVSSTGQKIVDSTVTDNGQFAFDIKLPNDDEQTIYNIKYNDQIIPLLVASGERIKIDAPGVISRDYNVSGSDGSLLMRELTMLLNRGAAQLDSIANIYTATSDEDLRKNLNKEYAQKYYKAKQNQIAFIINNNKSIAAIYALYQRLPMDNNKLFNGETDIIYYRMVADSVQTVHPTSPYLLALQGEISRYDKANAFLEIDMSKIKILEYPDVNMSDMYGKQIRLSSLEGKVVLIDFWSASVAKCRINNMELKDIYTQYSGKGFEVYQISGDTDKALWVTTIQDQKLPWISVCDFAGASSSALKMYNIQNLPANYIIDKQGKMVGKNLYGKDLEAKLKQLL